MKVPVYQKQVSQQIPTVRSSVQIPSAAAGVAADLTPLARGVESFINGLGKMNQQREQYHLAEAVNAFRRKNTEYLNAPDTGVFSRQGKTVWGSSENYDSFASSTVEEIAKERKMNAAQRGQFIQAVAGLLDSSLASVMRFEQTQSKKVADAEFDVTMQDSLNALSICYNDDDACQAHLDIAIGANAAKYAGFGNEILESKERELISQAQVIRAQTMLADDPRKAQAFFAAHEKDFLPNVRSRVKAAIEQQTDILDVQETTDALVKQFGDVRIALAYVHKNYEGDMENKLVSSVRSRFAEKELRAASAEESLRKQQQKTYENLVDGININGVIPPEAQLNQLRLDRKLSLSQHQNLLSLVSAAATRSTVERALRRDDEYNSMTPEQQESAVRARLGISGEERNGVLTALNDKLWNGTLTSAEISETCSRGFISKAEAEGLRKTQSAIDQGQKTFVRNARNEMYKRVRDVVKDIDPILADTWKQLVDEKLSPLDPRSPDYRKDATNAINGATVELMENYVKDLTEFSLGLNLLRGELYVPNEAGKLKTHAENNTYEGAPYGNLGPEDKTKAESNAQLKGILQGN